MSAEMNGNPPTIIPYMDNKNNIKRKELQKIPIPLQNYNNFFDFSITRAREWSHLLFSVISSFYFGCGEITAGLRGFRDLLQIVGHKARWLL